MFRVSLGANNLFSGAAPFLVSIQSPSMTEMLLKAQNAIGELYLDIGMMQKGLTYFQKAWSNLLRFTLSDLKISQELMKQKGRQTPAEATPPLAIQRAAPGTFSPWERDWLGNFKENFLQPNVVVHIFSSSS